MKTRALGRSGVWLAVSALILVGIFVIGAFQGKVRATEVTVYKSPTCGCCNKWIDHLQENGFSVIAVNRVDLSSLKAEQGIPGKAHSCHTALVGDYFVEGHVPAGDILRMLEERPDIRGLAVPGMPVGSPGMEGKYSEPYDVLALRDRGRTSVFARH